MVKNLRKKTKGIRRIFILVLITLVIFGAGVHSLEAGACERAARYCMDEIISPGNMLWHAYCLNGYLFCLKYVD